MRDRLDDLPLLIDVLLNRIVESAKLGQRLQFDPEALSVLRTYPWPGNVRELENMIERLAIDTRTGFISSADVSLELEQNGLAEADAHRKFIVSKGLRCLSDGMSVRHLSKRQELDLYLRELAHVGGDVTKVAR